MLYHLSIGFSLAFVGFITPAMLNMTTVRTTILSGKASGVQFAFGAALINCFQAFIAFTFANYLADNPNVILILKKAGIFILLGLSYFFYTRSKKKVEESRKTKTSTALGKGILLSTLNMLGLPYYFISSLGLTANNVIDLTSPNNYYLSIGVFLGGFSIFAGYVLLAEYVAKKSAFIAKNISLFLSILFLILPLLLAISIYLEP